MNNNIRDVPDKPLNKSNRLVHLGKILSAHELKGWVKIKSDTSPPENLANFQQILIGNKDIWEKIELQDSRVQGKYITLKLKGCDDRNSAEKLMGKNISVYRSQLPELKAEEEFYWADLVGLSVENLLGVKLGLVDHLIETGSNDVLVVIGNKEHLVPFIWDDVVREVRFEENKIMVDWDPEF